MPARKHRSTMKKSGIWFDVSMTPIERIEVAEDLEQKAWELRASCAWFPAMPEQFEGPLPEPGPNDPLWN